MDWETTIAMVSAGIAILLTPVVLFLLFKGVRSISDIRDLLDRPPRRQP